MTQRDVIDSLPGHLRQFVKVQDYDRYTPRDHAVWRFLLHRLSENLSETAHPVYREGLARTGISLEHVPSMDEMNACLGRIGWAAVVVDGFIPPAIFMEFQARRILPIALDMRSIDHMLYTPAPDIVHEAAGHAPFIVDTDYAEFLQRFGEVGMKALSTEADFAVYEAIRHLSIVKEAPVSTPQDIAAAEAALAECITATTAPSEAALLSRLHWWTVEYGLVGALDDYRIFGAGLLSSLGESVNCCDDDRVSKLPLTVDAVTTGYDITREQPQLFVTRSCKHLSQVLEAFARGMAFTQGGAGALRKAIECGTVATAEYSSGLQVSGRISRAITDAMGNEVYVATSGPTQLAYRNSELEGHGVDYHAQGFGSPVGQVKDMPRCLSLYTVDELRDAGIVRGGHVRLEFVSGITVAGQLEHIERRDHKNLLLRFAHCTVTGADGEPLFQPEWGCYDMAVGERITSVFGGTADREKFALYSHVPGEGTIRVEYSAEERRLFDLYRHLRERRERGSAHAPGRANAHGDVLTEICLALADYPREWLLRFEVLELMDAAHPLRARLLDELRRLRQVSEDQRRLIDAGLRALRIDDRREQ